MGGGRALTCPGAFALVQHPLVSAEGAVEPHGVVQRGRELGPVVGIGQQRRSQECVIGHIGSDAAVQLHVAFTYTNTEFSGIGTARCCVKIRCILPMCPRARTQKRFRGSLAVIL